MSAVTHQEISLIGPKYTMQKQAIAVNNGSLHILCNVYDSAYLTAGEGTRFEKDANGNEIIVKDYASIALDSTANAGVRRPYRGISIKKESFGSISVVKSKTKFSKLRGESLANSSVKDDVAFTSNFLINSVSESRQEKMQPVPTFGKDYVYFFGEQPRQMTFNCTLLNTENFRWEEEWWYNYDRYFRGTRLASSSETVRLRVDESIIYGYMITCSTNKDSNNPHSVTMSFTIHVTDVVSTRATKVGSHLVENNASNAYGYIDMNAADLGDKLPTITIGKDSQAIRDYNIKKYLKDSAEPPPGSVSRFLNNTRDFFNEVSNTYQEFVDFLYGRNLVLPADAAYAQFSSGNPAFAEGTEAFEVLQAKGLAGETAVYGKSKGQPFKNSGNKIGGSYTDNYDEYPYQVVLATAKLYPSSEPATASVTDTIIKEISQSFNIPEEDLRANEDGAFETTAQEKIRQAKLQTIESRAAFATYQITTALANNAVRKNAYNKGKYKVFPNEVFASGLVGLQYSK